MKIKIVITILVMVFLVSNTGFCGKFIKVYGEKKQTAYIDVDSIFKFVIVKEKVKGKYLYCILIDTIIQHKMTSIVDMYYTKVFKSEKEAEKWIIENLKSRMDQ